MSDRAAWLEARRRTIGGSDVAAILGLSKWGTPFSVWLDKTGQTPEQGAQWIHVRGHLMEPLILAMYGDQYAPEGSIVKPNTETMQGPARWHGGTPDAIVTQDGQRIGAADAKTSLDWAAWPREDWAEYRDAQDVSQPGGLGMDVACQGYHYIELLDVPWLDFVVAMVPYREDRMAATLWRATDAATWTLLAPTIAAHLLSLSEMRVFRLHRDRRTWARVIAPRLEAWWAKHIEQGVVLPPDGSDAAAAWVKDRVSGQDIERGVSQRADGHLAELLHAACNASAAAKQKNRDLQKARNRLALAMCEAQIKTTFFGGRSASLDRRGVLRLEDRR